MCPFERPFISSAFRTLQVKTRMQLETGRSKQGVLGAFQTIIKEEGCVPAHLAPLCPLVLTSAAPRQCWPSLPRAGPPTPHGGTEACHQVVRLWLSSSLAPLPPPGYLALSCVVVFLLSALASDGKRGVFGTSFRSTRTKPICVAPLTPG